VNVLNILRKTAHNSFNERAMRSMDEIEYRRVYTAEDLEPVITLRQKAYRAHSVYVNHSQPMTDEQDLDMRFYTFAVYRREQLISTLRVHIVNSENLACNSRDYFPDVIDPLIAQGLSFMDPTRFAIDPEITEDVNVIPLITLRLGFMAAKHFGTDFCLSMIKESHMAFYRKVFKSTQLTPFLPFSAVNSPYALFASPKGLESAICQSYPLFQSTETERGLLFNSRARGNPHILSVKPTANLVRAQDQSLVNALSAAS
jgi:hypothetical protein